MNGKIVNIKYNNKSYIINIVSKVLNKYVDQYFLFKIGAYCSTLKRRITIDQFISGGVAYNFDSWYDPQTGDIYELTNEKELKLIFEAMN